MTQLKRYIVALAIIIAGVSAASAQTEEQVVIDLRGAVTKAFTRERLRDLSSTTLEGAAMISISDCEKILNALVAFTQHANNRMNGVKSETGYKQSLLTELQTATSLERSALDTFTRGIELVPDSTTSEDLKRFKASLTRSRGSATRSFASFYSLAATLRQTPITLARSDAALKGVRYDDSKDAAVFRAALADMDRAIELAPSKTYYERRARIHTKLGNTAAATADTAKAASFTN